ncbi:MAG: zinc-ribbon domain-containing protein, partial [Actinomycetota bacterium]
MIVSCSSCQSRFKIDPAKVPAGGTRIRCPKCKGVITVGPVAPAPAPAPAQASAPAPAPGGAPAEALVVVAHGNAAFSETLAGFLTRNRFACETAHDGDGALAL